MDITAEKKDEEKEYGIDVQSFLEPGQDRPLGFFDPARWARYSFLEWTSIEPVPSEKQTQRNWYSVPLLWFSANANVLTFATGMLAGSFDVSLPASIYTILGFSLVTSIVPAYFTTFGTRLGLRQLLHSRYSFGYFGACILGILSAATQLVYCIENSILGGQALKAVSPNESMSSIVGIVILAIVSFVVCFFGIRVMHFVESILWFPTLICFILLTAFAGSGSNGLHIPENSPKTTSNGVLGLGCIVAGYMLSWSTIASDVSLYVNRSVSVKKLFFSVYAAFILSVTPIFMLGAAFGIAGPDVPAWKEASQESSPGALFNVVLSGHAGNFGKFLTVVLALSAVANIIPSVYSFGIACQTSFPILRRLPRFFMSLVALAIFLPLSIVGRNKFYDTLTNFASILAYWCGLFAGVVLADHCVIRRFDFKTYDITIWDDWRLLPPGIAGITSAILPIALLVPCMDQSWYTGPLARHSGDLAFEVGFILSFLLYLVLRPVEKRIWR